MVGNRLGRAGSPPHWSGYLDLEDGLGARPTLEGHGAGGDVGVFEADVAAHGWGYWTGPGIYSIVKEQPVEPFAAFAGVGFGPGGPSSK